MTPDSTALAAALQPLIARVRTDVTAIKKPNGEQAWTTQPLTPERLAHHLNGGPARGVCPIKEGESVTLVALLDFDSHGGEVGWLEMGEVVRRVVDVLELADGARPILFRSSGGRGVHLYLLWDEPQDARSVRQWLVAVLAAAGLRNGTRGVRAGCVEVFPKQDSVPLGGNGNQFILPLAGKSRAMGWCDLSGALVEVDQFEWPVSPAIPTVPVAEPRKVLQLDSGVGAGVDAPWRSALDALTNDGVTSLDYDEWRNVIFGIHHETGGSEDGLDVALAWSVRSPKHDEAFLMERVWPYVRSEGRAGGAVITGRTIMSIAARLHGWSEPLNGNSFNVVEGDDCDDFRIGLGVDMVGHRYGAGSAGVDSGDSCGTDVQVVARAEAGGAAAAHARPDGGDAGAVQGGEADDGGALPAAELGGQGDRTPDAAVVSVAQPAGRGRGPTGIPDAAHLATDQANANRLVRLHGKRVLVAESRWHVWDGARWLADEGDVYRYACGLSKVVGEEAAEWQRKSRRLIDAAWSQISGSQPGLSEAKGKAVIEAAVLGTGGARAVASAKVVLEGSGAAGLGGDLDEIKSAAALAENLAKWSVKSEMKPTIEAAVGLARKMLSIDADRLDADPWLLNTPTGVVDLRTGAVQAARASDLMTKLTGVGYAPGADQGVWKGLVDGICGGDTDLAAFLQRWFGYCATGSVREQVFVVHWGSGRNGKSTLLDTVARVLGDYAGSAAPGMLAGGGRGDGGDRHPTEIASLRGRRMVTAHESGDGAVLREDFVKQATGGDRLVARHMREDFFEFSPTHKLQLLTNHKPTIRGNDPAIWRRVLLVPYCESFGSEADLAAGLVSRLAEQGLIERLYGDQGALAGVMAWIVDGAVAWAAEGLGAPARVRAAVAEYRSEQDRLGQFVRECCEIAPAGVMAALRAASRSGAGSWWNEPELRAWSEPMTAGMQGLFATYTTWCREGGYHGLSRGRFGDSLKVAFSDLVIKEVNEHASGRRSKVTRVFGLKMLQD